MNTHSLRVVDCVIFRVVLVAILPTSFEALLGLLLGLFGPPWGVILGSLGGLLGANSASEASEQVRKPSRRGQERVKGVPRATPKVLLEGSWSLSGDLNTRFQPK